MTDSDSRLPEDWQPVLDDLDLEPAPLDAPPGEAAPSLSWFELYSKFATRGFVRALAGLGDDQTAFLLQFTVPAPAPDDDVVSAVRDESSDRLGGTWELVSEEPDWELSMESDDRPSADALRSWLAGIAALGDAVASDDLSAAPWFEERLDTSADDRARDSKSTETGRPERTGSASAPEGSEAFETIGDGGSKSPSSSALQSVGIANWELMEDAGEIEARIGLDGTLPAADVETLARELVHALRSRYDIAGRPVPADDSTDPPAAELRIRANPDASGLRDGESIERIRSDLENYFERLVRFDDLGVRIASVLGIGGDRSAPGSTEGSTGDSDRSVQSRKRGRGRHEESTSTPSSSDVPSRSGSDESRSRSSRESGTDRSEPSGPSTESDADERVVLDLGDEPSAPDPDAAPSPESGLEPGNYRDPRLMREDATTSLVDIVLRHPGYAEEKMGHNLSILLDVDYPDAMELVEQAPSVIAWGVGRERALDFKRFIEDSGGKVVLVEPDSLTD